MGLPRLAQGDVDLAAIVGAQNREDAVGAFDAYLGLVLSVVDSVGRLVAYLKETNQFDNTVIVFMPLDGSIKPGLPDAKIR